MENAVALLNVLRRSLAGRRSVAGTSCHVPPGKPPFRRRRLILEGLEQRLLLSADITPEAQSALSNGVEQVHGWAEQLIAHDELAQALPVVNTSLGQASDFVNLFQTKI